MSSFYTMGSFSLDNLVTQIQGLSGEDDLHLLHSRLEKAERNLFSESVSRLNFALNQLDPSQQSLGYLYILEAYVSNEKANGLAKILGGFLNTCVAAQIRLAPDKFMSVCRKFKDEILMLKSPIQGVAPMQAAVHKLQSWSGKVTCLHTDFLLLCLLAKCYKAGYSILEQDISEVDQPRDLFLYCYYGGMICIGMKRYQKAIQILYNVVRTPYSASNAICIEALKKYLLVSLIHNGQFTKQDSGIFTRKIRDSCQHYINLEPVYSSGKISVLQKYIEDNIEMFQQDNNLGLVKQVISSLHKRTIQRLTQTYLTLSLKEIADRVELSSPKEAEIRVLQMVEDGEIFATINQKDGMVTFHEDPERYKTVEMIDNIDSKIQRIMALSKRLEAVDEVVSRDAKKVKERRRFDDDNYEGQHEGFLQRFGHGDFRHQMDDFGDFGSFRRF